MERDIRAEFQKVERPHEYRGGWLGLIEIPITVITKNGTKETSQDWKRDHCNMHPLEHKHPWASEAIDEMYNQIKDLRFRTP